MDVRYHRQWLIAKRPNFHLLSPGNFGQPSDVILSSKVSFSRAIEHGLKAVVAFLELPATLWIGIS